MTTIYILLPRDGSIQLHPRFLSADKGEACESPHLFQIRCDLTAAQRNAIPALLNCAWYEFVRKLCAI